MFLYLWVSKRIQFIRFKKESTDEKGQKTMGFDYIFYNSNHGYW